MMRGDLELMEALCGVLGGLAGAVFGMDHLPECVVPSFMDRRRPLPERGETVMLVSCTSSAGPDSAGFGFGSRGWGDRAQTIHDSILRATEGSARPRRVVTLDALCCWAPGVTDLNNRKGAVFELSCFYRAILYHMLQAQGNLVGRMVQACGPASVDEGAFNLGRFGCYMPSAAQLLDLLDKTRRLFYAPHPNETWSAQGERRVGVASIKLALLVQAWRGEVGSVLSPDGRATYERVVSTLNRELSWGFRCHHTPELVRSPVNLDRPFSDGVFDCLVDEVLRQLPCFGGDTAASMARRVLERPTGVEARATVAAARSENQRCFRDVLKNPKNKKLRNTGVVGSCHAGVAILETWPPAGQQGFLQRGGGQHLLPHTAALDSLMLPSAPQE